MTVDRSQPADTSSVQRQELENGDCICYAYTGPQPQSAAVETQISSLMEARACPDAPAVAVPAGVAATTGSSAPGTLMIIGAAGVAAGAAALSDGDGGSSSP